MLRLLFLILLSCLLLPVGSIQAQSSVIQSFRLQAASRAVNSRGQSFAWPAVRSIDAVLELSVPQATKAEVLLSIEDATGSRLGRHKSKHTLAAGTQTLELRDVFSTKDVFGTRLLTARLQLELKGLPAESRELPFEVSGPPMPVLELTDLRMYLPKEGTDPSSPGRVQFDPGSPFALEATVNLSANPAGLTPRLIVLASMDEDLDETGPELPDQLYDQHWDVKHLEFTEGQYKVLVRGTLPYFFRDPWQSRHPFTIFVIADFGSGSGRVQQTLKGEVFDYRPGEDKRADEVRRRLISIGRASSWTVADQRVPDPNPEFEKYRPGR
jgi:hypothetical protein